MTGGNVMYSLLLVTLLTGATPIDKAAKLTQNNMYEESEAILKKITIASVINHISIISIEQSITFV
jgi:hypothetical protein